MVIDDLELDENGYPSDAVLERITNLVPWEAPRFMVHDFARLARTLPCSSVRERTFIDGVCMVHEIVFMTGGWSGCESFVEACIENLYIKTLSYAAWERGGKHVFRTPLHLADASG